MHIVIFKEIVLHFEFIASILILHIRGDKNII